MGVTSAVAAVGQPMPVPAPVAAEDWLSRFHAGDRGTMESCYRQHFATVERAIGPVLRGADRETVIHEMFSQLIASAELRQSFRGGSIGAWLATVARHRAIDFVRRLGREVEATEGAHNREAAEAWEDAADARLLIDRFCRDHLPRDWQGVFDLRFVLQLPQRQAAKQLSLHRTTLVYRELRIRKLLRHFLLGVEKQ